MPPDQRRWRGLPPARTPLFHFFRKMGKKCTILKLQKWVYPGLSASQSDRFTFSFWSSKLSVPVFTLVVLEVLAHPVGGLSPDAGNGFWTTFFAFLLKVKKQLFHFLGTLFPRNMLLKFKKNLENFEKFSPENPRIVQKTFLGDFGMFFPGISRNPQFSP